jgi:cytoskeletal protein RodZ
LASFSVKPHRERKVEDAMKYMLIAAALSLGLAGASLAQTSTPNSQTNEQPSASPNEPGGQMGNQQGVQKPCNSQASGTSDREGGNAKASTASGGPNSNPNGAVQSGC